MADTYNYVSTSYGATNLAAAQFVTLGTSPATNPDIELRYSVAAWTLVGSGSVPTDAQLKEAILLAIQRMQDFLTERTISTAGTNVLTS